MESIRLSALQCEEPVEVLTVEEETPKLGRQIASNIGAALAHGNTLVLIDADCTVSEHFFQEVSKKSQNTYFVGGGVKWVRLTRYSLGIIAFLVPLALYLIMRQITIGAFWVRKDVFETLGGFNPNNQYSDIDFAIKLKRYARKNQRKFESLKDSFIVWSTRKFEQNGDWHWLKGYRSER